MRFTCFDCMYLNHHYLISFSYSKNLQTLKNDEKKEPEIEVVPVAKEEDLERTIVEPESIVPADIKETIENTVIVESEEKPDLAKVDSAEKSTSSNHSKAEKSEMHSNEAETAKEQKTKSKETSKVREKRSPPLKPKHKPDEPLSNENAKKSSVDDVKVPMPKPVTALRSAAIRPVSARPSAPRRRDRNVKQISQHEHFMHEPIDAKKPEKKDLISEFDDGENIIITDIIQSTTSTTGNVDAIDNIADGKQGHLVQQILETQTVFMNADNDAKHGETTVRIR